MRSFSPLYRMMHRKKHGIAYLSLIRLRSEFRNARAYFPEIIKCWSVAETRILALKSKLSDNPKFLGPNRGSATTVE